MTQTITCINGDGIGQEVIPAARQVIQALNLPLQFQEAEAGFGTFETHGNALPAPTLAACESSHAILFGATSSPMTKVDGYQSPILSLRLHFDLFANLRPAMGTTRDGIEVDMLIVRENTEGLYSRRERVEDNGDTAIAERIITRHASERIVKIACEQAMTRRRHLTIVHKANVLKETDGLFREVTFSVTQNFPDLQVNELLIDTAAMRLVMNPSDFDVLVTTNLYGDILSDLAAGLVGGLGLAPSANVGEGHPAVFEPVHGSAPDIAGQGSADPRASILSAVLMLDFLGYVEQANTLRSITYATPHTGHTLQTTQNIIRQLEQVYASK